MIATLEFPGLRARAKPRPRTGKGFIYMPKTYKTWLERVRMEAIAQLRARYWQVQKGPLVVKIQIRQKAWRADLDQMAGAIMDALQGETVAYQDDSQITSLMIWAEVAERDCITVMLQSVLDAENGICEWVRQGEARQAGARRGRDMQAIKGRRKF